MCRYCRAWLSVDDEQELVTHCRDFYCATNCITSLPRQLGQIATLELFDCRGNLLGADMPQSLEELREYVRDRPLVKGAGARA